MIHNDHINYLSTPVNEALLNTEPVFRLLYHSTAPVWYIAGSVFCYETTSRSNDVDFYTKHTQSLYSVLKKSKEFVKVYDNHLPTAASKSAAEYYDTNCKCTYRYVFRKPIKDIKHVEFSLYYNVEQRLAAQSIVKLKPIRDIYYSIAKDLMSSSKKECGSYYSVRELFWLQINQYVDDDSFEPNF